MKTSFKRLYVVWLLLCVGLVSVMGVAFHVWALQVLLRKTGSVDPTYCPTPPEEVPLETGFSYETFFLPPAVHCSVNSKEAGWSGDRTTVLLVDSLFLWGGVALVCGCVGWLIWRGLRRKSISL